MTQLTLRVNQTKSIPFSFDGLLYQFEHLVLIYLFRRQYLYTERDQKPFRRIVYLINYKLIEKISRIIISKIFLVD